MRYCTLLLTVLLTAACAEAAPPLLDWEIQSTRPHDTDFFTQGLLIHEGVLYESTGLYGESRLIRYADDRESPQLLRNLEPRIFGEGIAVLDDQLFLLTWREGVAQIYDPASFSLLGSFSYNGEGWGITDDGQQLWMSDGSAELQQRSATGEVLGQISVRLDGEPLDRLNELEYVEGWILANRWFDTHIYLIDPGTGEVAAALDLSELAIPQLTSDPDRVLNGVAWDETSETLWVTGKRWSQLYELAVDLPPPPSP